MNRAVRNANGGSGTDPAIVAKRISNFRPIAETANRIADAVSIAEARDGAAAENQNPGEAAAKNTNIAV